LLGPIRIEDTLPEWIVHTDLQGQEDQAEGGSKRMQVGSATASPERVLSARGVVFTYSAVSVKRGEHVIGPLRVRASDPLGLFDFRVKYSLLSKVMTLPTPIRLDELRSITGGEFGDYQFEGGGSKGSGIDFHGVREYQPGDELRRVYWKSTARHGHLNVIEFEHSLAQDTIVALDLQQGTEVGHGQFSSLEYGIRLAAGLVTDAAACGSAVRLIGAGIQGSATWSGRGPDHLYSILYSLALAKADRTESLSSVLLERVEDIPRGSAVACVTSVADSRLAECAEFLRARQIRMTVVLTYLLPELPERTQLQIASLAAAGASVIAVGCSTDGPTARVTYQHAA
jgi:uncharacterized protein (DUF58 family)